MSKLQKTLIHLLEEAEGSASDPPNDHQRHYRQHLRTLRDRLAHLETHSHLRLLQQLLCIRHPVAKLPEAVLSDADAIVQQQRSHRALTRAETIQPSAAFARKGPIDGRIIVWQGDITTLANVTAITNAANEQGLGCFQPSHHCIDNAIHSWAGPRLRDDCHTRMRRRGRQLAPGDSITTRGHCLPANYVVHVVGPRLARDAEPTPMQVEQLAKCYRSVLDAAETLPDEGDGRKRVVLCGISTGLFAFPARQAASIAVNTVAAWLLEHPETTVTDIIFNTFTDSDHEIYLDTLASTPSSWCRWESSVTLPSRPSIKCDALDRARHWLGSTDAVIISAGAGLSASDGLDYTSTSLFARHFPGFLKYGLRTLYDVFGFSEWPTEQDRWGYYFTHLGMVKSWPESTMYKNLISWLERFGSDAHIRTSNADGLFIANGWPTDKLSTPQGSYAVLQCLSNCRPDSTVPSEPWLRSAQSSLDPTSQRLMDSKKVPRCQYCGSKMNICVRAADWFNETPFEGGEARWKRFRRRMRSEEKDVVILELGVGVSTSGVLRWPNEDLTRQAAGRVKLVRVGKGFESAVPSKLEEAGLATSIDGDITTVIRELLSQEV